VRSRLAYVACHHDLHVESCRTDNRVAGPLELDDVERTAVLEFDDMSTEKIFKECMYWEVMIAGEQQHANSKWVLI
jgi:hypothetical protein